MNQPEFTIKKGAIEAAAKFISENNEFFINQQAYINASIRKTIQRMMKDVREGKEPFRISTAGYTVLLGQEDYNYYVFEVLVDLQVSQDVDFVEII